MLLRGILLVIELSQPSCTSWYPRVCDKSGGTTLSAFSGLIELFSWAVVIFRSGPPEAGGGGRKAPPSSALSLLNTLFILQTTSFSLLGRPFPDTSLLRSRPHHDPWPAGMPECSRPVLVVRRTGMLGAAARPPRQGGRMRGQRAFGGRFAHARGCDCFRHGSIPWLMQPAIDR